MITRLSDPNPNLPGETAGEMLIRHEIQHQGMRAHYAKLAMESGSIMHQQMAASAQWGVERCRELRLTLPQ